MGIQPPSDLVLDVMQAADLARSGQVTRKLRALAAGAPAGFGTALATAKEAASDGSDMEAAAKAAALLPAGIAFSGTTLTALRNAHALSQRTAPPLSGASGLGTAPAATAAFKKFEAMALGQFLDTLMPNSTGVFGGGTAGRTWKSLLAEKLGTHVAEGGGIGIAARLARNIKAGGAS